MLTLTTCLAMPTSADYEEIVAALAAAGAAARAAHQRLTCHPSHFVQRAATEPALLARSIAHLELNSRVRWLGCAGLVMYLGLGWSMPCPGGGGVHRLAGNFGLRLGCSTRLSLPPRLPHQVFDLMGYAPSYENKINIHIGTRQGSKAQSLARFAAGVERLSDACRARLTGGRGHGACCKSFE